MSTEKATVPSAAEMPSTMEVSTRMLPWSGESAALRRSAETQSHIQYPSEATIIRLCCLMRLCVNCTHPHCCSSACTAPGCCSTPGCCSRCCLNWAHLTTTPVTMEMHTQKLLSVTLCYDTAHPAPNTHTHTTNKASVTPQMQTYTRKTPKERVNKTFPSENIDGGNIRNLATSRPFDRDSCWI